MHENSKRTTVLPHETANCCQCQLLVTTNALLVSPQSPLFTGSALPTSRSPVSSFGS